MDSRVTSGECQQHADANQYNVAQNVINSITEQKLHLVIPLGQWFNSQIVSLLHFPKVIKNYL